MIFCVLKEHTMTNREQLAMMAELKDEQFAKEKQALIDKACEWLQKHINDYLVKGRDIDYMFDDFRKAMKGGKL